MKYIFIASAASLCFLTGIYKAGRLSKRRREIEEILDLFEEIRRQIKYRESTLESIITAYCKTKTTPFLKKISEYVKEDDFPLAWKKAFSQSNSALDESEKQTFISFGDKLGTTDSASQDKLIGYMLSYFEKQLQKAEREECEKKRLYIVTSVAAGMTIIILMM